jgi:hypothetical protein
MANALGDMNRAKSFHCLEINSQMVEQNSSMGDCLAKVCERPSKLSRVAIFCLGSHGK